MFVISSQRKCIPILYSFHIHKVVKISVSVFYVDAFIQISLFWAGKWVFGLLDDRQASVAHTTLQSSKLSASEDFHCLHGIITSSSAPLKAL